jgi:hypothetical protein
MHIFNYVAVMMCVYVVCELSWDLESYYNHWIEMCLDQGFVVMG